MPVACGPCDAAVTLHLSSAFTAPPVTHQDQGRAGQTAGLIQTIAQWGPRPGLRNADVAEKLFISTSAVRIHLRSICEKLNDDGHVCRFRHAWGKWRVQPHHRKSDPSISEGIDKYSTWPIVFPFGAAYVTADSEKRREPRYKTALPGEIGSKKCTARCMESSFDIPGEWFSFPLSDESFLGCLSGKRI